MYHIMEQNYPVHSNIYSLSAPDQILSTLVIITSHPILSYPTTWSISLHLFWIESELCSIKKYAMSQIENNAIIWNGINFHQLQIHSLRLHYHFTSWQNPSTLTSHPQSLRGKLLFFKFKKYFSKFPLHPWSMLSEYFITPRNLGGRP